MNYLDAFNSGQNKITPSVDIKKMVSNVLKDASAQLVSTGLDIYMAMGKIIAKKIDGPCFCIVACISIEHDRCVIFTESGSNTWKCVNRSDIENAVMELFLDFSVSNVLNKLVNKVKT